MGPRSDKSSNGLKSSAFLFVKNKRTSSVDKNAAEDGKSKEENTVSDGGLSGLIECLKNDPILGK